MSGGEGTVINTLFMISLWEASRSPIRIIDEYDVFTDPANHQLVFQEMVQIFM